MSIQANDSTKGDPQLDISNGSHYYISITGSKLPSKRQAPQAFFCNTSIVNKADGARCTLHIQTAFADLELFQVHGTGARTKKTNWWIIQLLYLTANFGEMKKFFFRIMNFVFLFRSIVQNCECEWANVHDGGNMINSSRTNDIILIQCTNTM